ncbi:MAG: IS200/IS605 family transposase [Anaerolineales bacterium]|nr:IS200/IS605 family transposase [Anaerolineales bacterium]MCB9127612.1 IS200/IS605 family transposase [Ardenticatenales bacterium]
MGRNHLELYVHFVWGTWDRQPIITTDIERPLYRAIQERAQWLGCEVLALNGMEDHTHLLLSFTSRVTMAEIMKEVKGGSSNAINKMADRPYDFKWQGGYGAFTVSKRQLPQVIRYVEKQKAHHAANQLYMLYELPLADHP